MPCLRLHPALPLQPHVPTQLALPMICLDDSTGAPMSLGACIQAERTGTSYSSSVLAIRRCLYCYHQPLCLGCVSDVTKQIQQEAAAPLLTPSPANAAGVAVCAEAYEPEYEHSIMYVQEYRPSDLLEADNGEGGGQLGAAQGTGGLTGSFVALVASGYCCQGLILWRQPGPASLLARAS